jgi:hypothetical protein
MRSDMTSFRWMNVSSSEALAAAASASLNSSVSRA